MSNSSPAFTFDWRPLRASDVPDLTALSNTVVEHDGSGRPTSEEVVAEELDAPQFDIERDTVTVWDDDRLIAASTVWMTSEPVEGHAMARVFGEVHPEYRGRGIGTELLARAEVRAAELAQQRLPGLPIRFRAVGGTPDSDSQHLLEHHGYVPDKLLHHYGGRPRFLE